MGPCVNGSYQSIASGLIQSWASVTQGLWLARSEDFMQQTIVTNLRWLRMVGDTIMILGGIGLLLANRESNFHKETVINEAIIVNM